MIRTKKTKYLELFNNIQNQQHVEKILVIDGTNTFIRAVIANPLLSDNGIHMGGIQGFLMSIGFAIRRFKISNVVIVFDGKEGSKNRKKLYEEYKGKRTYSKRRTSHSCFYSLEEEQNALKFEMIRLLEYLKCLPVKIVIADYIEADDIIAYISKNYGKDNKIMIMSTDKDFFQLISENAEVWSPTKKILYTKDNFHQICAVKNPENFIYARIVEGDDSDNINGISGIKRKTLQKILPVIFESEKTLSIIEVINYINEIPESKLKAVSELKKNIKIIERNYKLMNLHNQEFITNNMEIILKNSLTREKYKLNKFGFLSLLIEDQISTLIKDPESWIKDIWIKLDFNRDILHEYTTR